MAELRFTVALDWEGAPKDGEGTFASGGSEMPYSGPASMGGKGVGTSPEDLLTGAIAACYSITLAGILRAAKLPVTHLHVGAEGVVSDFPQQSRFTRITVSPSIAGADVALRTKYIEAATKARDKCFIGRTVRDYLDYGVGEVSLSA